MITIAIANQKGGVGKSTYALNLAAGLTLKLNHRDSEHPGKVLFVDMDPQTSTAQTLAGGIYCPMDQRQDRDAKALLSDLLTERFDLPPQAAILTSHIPVRANQKLDYIPSRQPEMQGISYYLSGASTGDERLLYILEELEHMYEFCIIDTPPNIERFTQNSLIAAHYVIVPVQLRTFSLAGLNVLRYEIQQIQRRKNPQLELLGLQPTLCNFRRVEEEELLESLRESFGDLLLPPISDRAEVEYANGEGLDIFSFRPPADRTELASSNLAAQEFGRSVEEVWKRVN